MLFPRHAADQIPLPRLCNSGQHSSLSLPPYPSQASANCRSHEVETFGFNQRSPKLIQELALNLNLYHQFQGLEGRQIACAGFISDCCYRIEIIYSRPITVHSFFPLVAQTEHTMCLIMPKNWSDLTNAVANPAEKKASLGKPGPTESYNPSS